MFSEQNYRSYVLVEELQKMQRNLHQLHEQVLSEDIQITSEEILELQLDYKYMLKAILWMLEGARYLWDVVADLF